jgi:hypothetical protein
MEDFLEIGSLIRIVTEVLNDAMNSRGLVHRSRSTEDEIVNKKKGVDGWTVRPQRDAQQVRMVKFVLKANGELINGHNEKVGREGAALADSPLGGERSGQLTINKDGEGQSRNACMDEPNEISKEPHSVERSGNEIPVEAVEGLSKVEFKKETIVVPTLKVEGVDDFLSDDNIGRNMHILNESHL